MFAYSTHSYFWCTYVVSLVTRYRDGNILLETKPVRLTLSVTDIFIFVIPPTYQLLIRLQTLITKVQGWGFYALMSICSMQLILLPDFQIWTSPCQFRYLLRVTGPFFLLSLGLPISAGLMCNYMYQLNSICTELLMSNQCPGSYCRTSNVPV